MKRDNSSVVEMFLRGEIGASRSMTTNGRELYSYQSLIGLRVGEKGVVVVKPTRWSRTTGRHVGILRDIAQRCGYTITEVPKESMASVGTGAPVGAEGK